MKNIIKIIAKSFLYSFDRIIALVSKDRAVFNNADFEQYDIVEHNWQVIRDEFLNISEEKIDSVPHIFKEQQLIAAENAWDSNMLIVFGIGIKENMADCPATTSLMRDGHIVSAFFSILKAGHHLEPHRGIFKGVVRAHLPLIVPDGDCYMTLNGEKENWQEGKLLFFDDTFKHDVTNQTSSDRVVLLFDIIRPLPFPLNYLNRAITRGMAQSHFIQNIMREMKKSRPASMEKIALQF